VGVLTGIGRGRALAFGLAGWLAASALLGQAAAPALASGSAAPGPASGSAALGPAAGAAGGLRGRVRAAERAELQAIEVPAAWKLSTGQGVTVGVLDTGVDSGAPDLAGSVTTGPDYTKGADPLGYHPPHLHGTYIASLIAGHGSGPGRTGGVIGVAPAAKVLSVRVILDDEEPGFGLYSDAAQDTGAIDKGIRYAADHGVKVINMSLGTTDPSRGMRSAIGYAVSRGVVVVAAAGNSGSPGRTYAPYSYPASFTGVISVAALTGRGTRAYFSERNSSVVISAPGVSIVGAGPERTYLQASGTSPASAFVAGVAALIRSAYPALSPALVEQALLSSTRRRPSAGYGTATGFGEVDAVAAVRAAGRLAAARPAAGLAASAHFGGGAPGPIQVVHRDSARIVLLGGLGVVGALGFLAAFVILGVALRRDMRDQRMAP
jgi:type VII secretion-associated serine protease mycosin